jgi:hypothetical protein
MVGGAELRSTAEKPKELPWEDTSGFPKDSLWIQDALNRYPEGARKVSKVTKKRPLKSYSTDIYYTFLCFFIFS